MFTFVYLYEWMTTFKYSRFFKNVGISVSNINVFYPHSNNLYFGEKRHKLLLRLFLTHVKWPSADRCMNNVQNSYISNCQESVTNVCMVILNRTHPLTESRASIVGCPFNACPLNLILLDAFEFFFFFFTWRQFSPNYSKASH